MSVGWKVRWGRVLDKNVGDLPRTNTRALRSLTAAMDVQTEPSLVSSAAALSPAKAYRTARWAAEVGGHCAKTSPAGFISSMTARSARNMNRSGVVISYTLQLRGRL